ncbi:MAG: glycosyltransferase family 2 protein [Bacteroidetes bacterium]|nr:glycosyltransferase family 2 protein [Bacteroidota bacterium]
MLLFKILFWLGILTIVYSYAGYGLLVWFLLRAKKLAGRARPEIATPAPADLPSVTLIIAAYNEEDFIRQKIDNTLSLDYPHDKFRIIFITDGSSDATPRLAGGYDRITVLHRPERKGKVAAMHRAMQHVTTPIVIFSDANTLLNKESIYNIARHYQDPKTGGVAGEKKITETGTGKVAGIGEGIYWKYESFLKKMDAALYTVVGAAGELFSIRTELYEPVGDNVLLDDFVISLRVCQKGYRVHYEPGAYAMETPSASLKEERKRKIRISAGAFQSMGILIDLLNLFKYPILSFQYISHRVLRWTACPLLLPVVFIANLILVIEGGGVLYQLVMAGQILFYVAAMAGWLLANRNVKSKLLYVPYYFFFLNFSLYQGFFRHLKGRQSVLWDKARRETPTPAQ